MTLEKRKFAYGISTTYNSCSFRPVVNVPLAKVKQRRQKESSVPPGYFYFILYFSPTIFACARVNDVICITRVMHTQRRARWSALLVSFRSIPVLGFLSRGLHGCALPVRVLIIGCWCSPSSRHTTSVSACPAHPARQQLALAGIQLNKQLKNLLFYLFYGKWLDFPGWKK
jgi:hypothetical protein